MDRRPLAMGKKNPVVLVARRGIEGQSVRNENILADFSCAVHPNTLYFNRDAENQNPQTIAYHAPIRLRHKLSAEAQGGGLRVLFVKELMKNKKQYRQGDVLIERVTKIKMTGKNAKTRNRTVLAHGEATGHAHEVFEPTAKLVTPSTPDQQRMSTLLLKLGRDAEVKHQEHSPIPLTKGTYKITRQREYSPEAIRNVQD